MGGPEQGASSHRLLMTPEEEVGSGGHPRAPPVPFDVYTPRAKNAGEIFIYLGNLKLLSNSYFKVPFLFVIKGEISFSTASG